MERLPALETINYVDQQQNPSQLLLYRAPCPVAFKRISYTALSKFSFKPLAWLMSHPELNLDLLEFGYCLPYPQFFDEILIKAGPNLRRLHVFQMDNDCLQYLARCTMLEELKIGQGKSGPSALELLQSVPPSTRRVKIFGSVYPLDLVFPSLFDTLRDLPSVNTLSFICGDRSIEAFTEPSVQRDWVDRCQALGVKLLFHRVEVNNIMTLELLRVPLTIFRLNC